MSEYLLISDAAKEVQVESHVLRYWEEELHLPIKRNELGHRFYTREDVERFLQIKSMKERGLQLKAIKMILKEGRLDLISGLDGRWLMENNGDRKEDASREKKENSTGEGCGDVADEKSANAVGSAEEPRQQSPHIGAQTVEPSGRAVENGARAVDTGRKAGDNGGQAVEAGRKAGEPYIQAELSDAWMKNGGGQRAVSGAGAESGSAPRMGIEIVESRDLQEVSKTNPEDRSRRLQWLLRQMMQEAVRENNEELCRSIKESVIKELDYQFRMQEERQDEREKESLQRSEEYYRRMDELLRQRARGRRIKGQELFSKGGSQETRESGEKPQKRKNRALNVNGDNRSGQAKETGETVKGNPVQMAGDVDGATTGNERKTIFRFWAPGRKTV